MDPLVLLLIGMGAVIGGILLLRLHAFLALLAGGLIVSMLTPSDALVQFQRSKNVDEIAARKFANTPSISRLTTEFGASCGKIGVLIALASVTGRCLLDSGAADVIVRTALRWTGERGAPVAFGLSGFVLGIPVFFDTVFLLMIPLAKALWKKMRKGYVLHVMAIIAGATMTHSLVPPTPGPLFVAEALKVNMAAMVIGGTIVGALTASAGMFYAYWISTRLGLPEDFGPKIELAKPGSEPKSELVSAEPENATNLASDEGGSVRRPSLAWALSPVLLPLVLIIAANIWGSEVRWLRVVGESNLAMGLAATIAMATLVWQRAGESGVVGGAVGGAVEEAGVIILTTAAGGAFGGVLQQTGIAARLEGLTVLQSLGIIPMAWGVTALVRFAQGSATVAMITAVGIVSGMVSPEKLGFHPVYVALAIGCGSKMFPWMNDSGFWVISKLAGLDEARTLKTFSLMLSIMGFVGLGLLLLGAQIFPGI